LGSGCRLAVRPSRARSTSGSPDPSFAFRCIALRRRAEARAVRPHGRRTDPRGVTRTSRGSGGESSAGTGSALPAIRFGGVPVFLRPPQTANVSKRSASRSLAPPFRAHPEVRHRSAKTGSALLGFGPLQRMRSRRFGSRGHKAMPATFRPQRFARSRRLAPCDTVRACFIPVTLMGFRLQGFVLPGWAEPLSRPVALLPFRRP